MTTINTEEVTTQAPAVNSGFAIAAMVLGIVGIFLGWLYLVLPALAIIFAGVDLARAASANRKPSGMAVTGLVLGITMAAIYGLIFIAAFAA